MPGICVLLHQVISCTFCCDACDCVIYPRFGVQKAKGLFYCISNARLVFPSFEAHLKAFKILQTEVSQGFGGARIVSDVASKVSATAQSLPGVCV